MSFGQILFLLHHLRPLVPSAYNRSAQTKSLGSDEIRMGQQELARSGCASRPPTIREDRKKWTRQRL
jgi:hypothetical protein